MTDDEIYEYVMAQFGSLRAIAPPHFRAMFDQIPTKDEIVEKWREGEADARLLWDWLDN